MKYFKIIIIACVSILAFIACSGDEKREDVIVDGKTFQQSATLPASKADTTIILSDLKAAINSVKGGNEWLTVVKESYTSGSPKVRLTAKENKEEKSRDCKVTITAESGDKVVLSINQEGCIRKQTFYQSATLPAIQADTIIALSDLKTAISSIEGSQSWVTVSKQSYTSGSPKVRLTAQDNKEETPRDCKVTITAESGDKVVLTVEQNGAEPKKTGIDDSHDVPTDQPAYSREI